MDEHDQLVNEIDEIEARLMSRQLPDQTASLLEQHITLQQFRALILLATKDDVASSELAEVLGVRPNVATGIIQRLVARDLVQRSEDPTDLRVRRLRLTPTGRTLMEDIATAMRRRRRGLLQRLPVDRLRQLRDIFAEMEAAAREEQDRS